MKANKYKLCYVYDNIAYFTTQDISKQRGDDWDDVPYEHNAGEPYEPCWHNHPDYINKKDGRGYIKPGELCKDTCCINDWNDDGTPKWEIKKLYYKADLATPDYNYNNSPYSVDDINKGRIPWLRSGKINIYAGTPMDIFCIKIRIAGGSVYEKKEVV